MTKRNNMQGKIGRKAENIPTDVIHFDFNQQLLSLLEDEDLMQQENLVIDPDDPFGEPPQRQPGEPFECHHAQRYAQIREEMINDPTKEVALPIILYIDKTHIDRGGRFTLEPVIFTLSIFNEKARRHHKFWRLLGYISPVKTHQTSSEKQGGIQGQHCRNFHRQLRTIFQGLVKNQRGEDELLNNTDVTLGEVTQRCETIHTPLLFVIADGECADLLVGRYGSHNLKVKRICRRCNVKSDQLSNPRAKFKLFKQRRINRLVLRRNKKKLKEISQHGNYNAFMDVSTGVKGLGIVNCLPNELMHMVRQGVINYCLNILYDVVGNSLKTQLDQMVREFTRKCRQSILKDYPRMNPRCGVTNVNNMTGDERLGVMFILTMMTLNEEIWTQMEGTKLSESGGKQGNNNNENDAEYTVSGFVNVFEMLLCFTQWSTAPESIWATSIDDFDEQEEEITEKMLAMLEHIKAHIPRMKKQKWNIQKFHSLVHLAADIMAFGGTRNFDASRPESFHQPLCKEPGRRSQKTHQNWTLMVAEKVKEARAMNAFRNLVEKEDKEEQRLQTFESVKKRSTKFFITFNPTNMKVVTKWKTTADVRKMELEDNLLNFVVQHYGIDESHDKLTCFTECLVQCDDGTHAVVRCHPNYQSKGPWNDWGMIRHGNQIVPAKFHMFIDRKTTEPEAIVQLGERRDRKKDSVLTSSWTFPLPNDDYEACIYHQISVKDYVRPCLVFEKKTSQQILVVLPFEEWYAKF